MNIKQLLIATILLLSSAAYGQRDFEEIKLLAEQGNARGQYNLGFTYANGSGVPKNDAEAVKWFRLAAEQGLANAQSDLGAMYESGRGIPKNDAEAVKWYRLAAEQGFASAQMNLGVMYANGSGVSQNNFRAYVWSSVAAAQGYEDAKTNRDMLSEKLTPALLGQAQQIATKCSESDYQSCESKQNSENESDKESENSDQQARHLFSPEGCEFPVNFPVQPELTTLYADNVGEWVQANYNNSSEVYFLRAECISLEVDATALKQVATTYAQSNGLENTAYEFGEDNTGEFAKFTGYKTLNGLAITFRVYMYAAEESYITLYAGSPSSSYPQRAILEFFESLKIGR